MSILFGESGIVFDTVGKMSWANGRTLLRPGGICLDTDLNVGKLGDHGIYDV